MGTKVTQKLPIILNPIIEDIIRQTDRLAFEGVVSCKTTLIGYIVVLWFCPYYLMPILPSLLKGWLTYYI